MSAPTADRALDSWALVQRAQAGDREAFAEIYRRYHQHVFRFAYNRTHDQAAAEDITQDTFERALRHIGRFTRPDRDYSAWLITIARNLVADRFKRAGFRLEITTGDAAGMDIRADFDVERQVEQDDDAETVRAALAFLTADQRQAITLQYLGQLSVAETAARMGRNEGAIKALTGRGRTTMARALHDLGRGRA